MSELTAIGGRKYNVASICTHLLNIERAARDSELNQISRLARELITDLMEERMMRAAEQQTEVVAAILKYGLGHTEDCARSHDMLTACTCDWFEVETKIRNAANQQGDL